MSKKNTALTQATEHLKLLRKKQRELRKEIDTLRKEVRDAGGYPDAPEVDLIGRNKAIFKAWKDGRTYREIAAEYKLSAERIRSICKRIELILKNKRHHFDKYKDLLSYNN